jgi:hypothetical protein
VHTQTAAAEIHEEQLLNFIVNRLTEAVPLDLGANASLAPEDLWEVLVGACVDGTSVSTLCASSEAAPHANTVLHHLRTKLDLDALGKLANSLLQTEALDVLPDRAEFVVDLHLRPYYGDEADTDGLYYSQARAGTTAFHAYATLYARVRNKRFTLAIRRVTDGDTPSQVLAAFLGLLDSLDVEVIAVYLDREFYDSKCLTLLQAHNVAYVMPVVKWGRSIKQELSQGWSRTIRHSLTARVDGAEWTVEFPVYIDATYQRGKYDEHGVARHGYAADAPFVETPRQARYHYAKRFGIEASYRLGEQATASTTTQDPAMRLLFVVVSLVIQNSWRYLHWEYVSMPRKGGRRLWSWPFEEFVAMVTRAAWRALRKRQAVPTNRPPDDRFER